MDGGCSDWMKRSVGVSRERIVILCSRKMTWRKLTFQMKQLQETKTVRSVLLHFRANVVFPRRYGIADQNRPMISTIECKDT
jgi:hypothetical protein